MQTTEQEQLHGLSTADLVRHALEEARLLAKAEVLHAKEELKQELGAAKTAGILLGACATLALTALSVLFVALALALPLPPVASLAMVGCAVGDRRHLWRPWLQKGAA